MNLSKSQYMKGLQCSKALWLFENRKELAAEPDQRRQNLFATGHRVGNLAKQLFPGGAEVEYRQSDYQGMIDEIAQLTKSENVTYEGSFSTNGVFVRADMLDRQHHLQGQRRSFFHDHRQPQAETGTRV